MTRRKTMHEHIDEHDHDHDHEHDHDEHDHNHDHNHDHEHDHDDKQGHGHEHGKVDADLYGTQVGLRAVQISTAGKLLVAVSQFAVAVIGRSAGLFADPPHNLSNVLTTVASS